MSFQKSQKAYFVKGKVILTYSANMVKRAVMQHLGYICEATTYAEDLGGGDCDTRNWERDKDEDEQEWIRRCLHQAARMIKPRRGRRFRR